MAQAGGSSGEIHRRWVKQEPDEHLLRGVRLWMFVDNDFSKPPAKYNFYVDKDMFYLYARRDDPSKDCLIWDMLYISDVRGAKFPSKSDQEDDTLDDRFLQLVYRKEGIVGLERLHFLAASAEEAKLFMDSVNKLTGNLVAMNASPLTFLKKHHFLCTLHANGRGEISLKSLRSLLKVKPNIKDVECPVLSTLEPRGCMHESEDGGKAINSNDFTFEMFMSIYSKLVNQREDVQRIVEKYSKKNRPYLSSDEFWTFVTDQRQLTQLQNELIHPALKKDEAIQLVEKFEPSRPRTGTSNRLTPAGLISYLLSDENSVIQSSTHCQCENDMSQPLNHYYINSSHNTYLTGSQLRSASTVEMYIQTLLLGCRCIELDCWVYRREIVITHGGTLCTKILFKDVLEAIRDYAFVASDYPVILSIENHVKGEELLNSMASMYDVILGDLLLKEPIQGYPLEQDYKLPPPEKLKRKIIIKDKIRGPKTEQRSVLPSIDESPMNGYGTLERVLRDTPQNSTLERNFKMSPLAEGPVETSPNRDSVYSDSVISTEDGDLMEPDLDQENLGDDVSINELVRMARPSEGVALSSKSLIALLNYCTAVKFYNFESFEEQKCPHLMFSLDEDKAFTQLQRNAISYVQYNMRQNSRIYPAGARFNSSNYMPQIYWSAGCQMVALNYQTPDTAMQLNLAKFEWNGGTGFLLKPGVLRLPRPKPFHPFIRTPIDNVHPVTLSVKVLSGQFLSDSRVFVEVELYGLPVDSQRKAHKTRALPGPHPVWGESDKPFHFKRIILPEMAMIRFVVYDESNQITGQRFLPVECLNAGYRHLVLRDPWNQPIGLPTLFVHIEAKVYVPNHMEEAVEALMNPIEHMKKQVRNLMEDLTEDEVRLGVQNPHFKLKTNELIDQLNLPKEMLMDTRPVVKPAKETLPPILMDARSRPEPVAATMMATEVTSQKKVRELEQKMKQSDEKMRKKFQEKEQQIQKKKDKVKVKANEERRKSQVLSDYDVKMEELVNIASAKRRVNRLKHEEKIFKIKCSVLGEIHKKELLSLDKKHKKEFDDLRLQTSRIGANMRSESKEEASKYAFSNFQRWSNDLKTIHSREKEALKRGQEEAFVKAEAMRPSVSSDNGTVLADEFSSQLEDDVILDSEVPAYNRQHRKHAISSGEIPVFNKASSYGEAQESTVDFSENGTS